MTNQWDSPENLPSDRRLEFGCGRIVARMPDIDDCQPIQRTLSPSTSIQVFLVRSVDRFFSRFRKQAVIHELAEPPHERSIRGGSNKRMFFSALILLGVLCITAGGAVLLHKQHKKAQKEKAAAIALQKKEAAEKAAADKAAADKVAKAAAEKAAADKAAADKVAKAAAEKAAAEKAAAEKAVAENNVPTNTPSDIRPNATAANPQSPWERPATEAYSPWGMASTRQMAVAAVSPQPIPQSAIPMAPGTIGQKSPPYGNYGTMVAPPMVAANAYRPYSAPVQANPQQNVAQGRVPMADSPLTYQNVTGMTASGHYVPSAVHTLSQMSNRGSAPPPTVASAPNAIRPLGPIPKAAPMQQGQVTLPMVDATGYPPQPPSVNYPPPAYNPYYQQEPNRQPQPMYQPNYQPQPNDRPPVQNRYY